MDSLTPAATTETSVMILSGLESGYRCPSYPGAEKLADINENFAFLTTQWLFFNSSLDPRFCCPLATESM